MNAISLERLGKVHPKLRMLMIEAAKTCPLAFEISEGMRTKARQKTLFDAGASMTMNSRHLTGHAVDIFVTINGKIRWDWPLYVKAGEHIKAVAVTLGIPIVWGGDWRKLRDGPHYEMDRRTYP